MWLKIFIEWAPSYKVFWKSTWAYCFAATYETNLNSFLYLSFTSSEPELACTAPAGTSKGLDFHTEIELDTPLRLRQTPAKHNMPWRAILATTSPMRGIKLAPWSNVYPGPAQNCKTHDNSLLGVQSCFIVIQVVSVFLGYSDNPKGGLEYRR